MAPSGRNPASLLPRGRLLTNESARTLAAYHRLKQQGETSRANEGEILKLVGVADEARMKLKAAELRRTAAEEQSARLERARTKLEREIKAKEEGFLSLHEQSLGLRNKLRAYEEKVVEYEQRMACLRTIAEANLKNTAGYDEIMQLSRPLPPISEAPSSGHATPMDTEETAGKITKKPLDVHDRTPTRASDEKRRGKKRSASASRVLDDEPNAVRRQLTHRSPRMIVALNSNDLRNVPTAIANSWTQGRAIEKREHLFFAHKGTQLFSMLMNNACACCNSAISSAPGIGVTCKECRINIHARCKGRAPLPCLPASVFPMQAFDGKAKHNLADLCPSCPPFIPALVLRCVFALEQNRLNAGEIYRVVADKKAVEDLHTELMKQKLIPDMSLRSTEVICGTLLKFLRFLKDPLVPRSSFREFVKAATCTEMSARERQLQEAIAELPLPNQHTLAFLVQHLQKVAHFATENGMPVENLARCFAPVLLSGRQSTLTNLGRAEAENERETAAVHLLLEMPADFWSGYLDQRTATTAHAKFETLLAHVLKNATTTSGNPQASRSRADRPVSGSVTYAPKNFTPRSRTPGRVSSATF